VNKDFTDHEKYMQRCIELAEKGLGNTYTNPVVGAVIVHNNKIIGEGYHKKFGENHAEVNAVNSVKNKSLLKESTIYVSLEPCSHIGKTPACSTMIIENKIPKVVIGTIDTFSKVSGNGVKMLENAGIQVKIGVLEDECRELNKRFFTYHEKNRPYIILKWAQTKDGFIDILRKNKNQHGAWITNELCRNLVHKWRTQEQAIMIGTNTAVLDNPSLNVRNWTGKNPIRICIDKDLKLNHELKIFDQSVRTLIFTEKIAENSTNIEFITINFKINILPQIMQKLYGLEIQSVIIEGGEILLNSFIAKNLWDEARIFVGNKFFIEGTKAPFFNLSEAKKQIVDDAELYTLKNNKQ